MFTFDMSIGTMIDNLILLINKNDVKGSGVSRKNRGEHR